MDGYVETYDQYSDRFDREVEQAAGPTQLAPKLLSWASILETEARLQAERTARLDVVDRVALMPDAHFGMGATVGSVIATENVVIPAAVGVDIGCGMIASHLALSASDLPDNLEKFLPIVTRAVPAGLGKGHELVSRHSEVAWRKYLHVPASFKQDSKLMQTAQTQLGSLGSGNHFFEICLDENDQVWAVLHSGSRGIGNQLARGHIKTARQLAKFNKIKLEDYDLAYLAADTDEFNAYIHDMLWAQEYAHLNREIMMDAVLEALGVFLGGVYSGNKMLETDRINCHHNFTQREVHDGKSLWITRKGAIKADTDDLGVIPGSMGARSYVVHGLGNRLSFNSCSHGAGRTMSRTAAKKAFDGGDLKDRMEGIIWQQGAAKDLVDEIPDAYKSIDVVMNDQKDLVYVVAELHQILNYKGT